MSLLLPLSELKAGDSAIVKSLADDALSIKFLEMGCIPGEIVKVENIAPLGDPMAISINGSVFSLRKSEAVKIIVMKEEKSSHDK